MSVHALANRRPDPVTAACAARALADPCADRRPAAAWAARPGEPITGSHRAEPPSPDDPMPPSLLDLDPGTFRVRTRDGARTLRDLVAEADKLAPSLPGAVLEIPARDPVETLIHLEAALSRGLVPVPAARAKAPTALAVTRDLPDAELALYTSGSTGAPRLPAFTFASLARSAQRIAAYLGLTRDDEIALLQPLDHGFGLVGQLFAAIAGGAAVVDCSSPYPDERAEAVANAQATVVAAVPHTLQELAEHLPEIDPAAAHQLRSVGSAGGRLPPALARRLALAFPEAVIWNQYGCTEAGPRLCAVPSSHVAFYTGTVGRAIDGVLLWVADARGELEPAGRPGEICFSSDTQMLGYLGDPAATARQRRQLGNALGYTTGDVGLLDADDRLHVLGRADDLVKVRGERVSLESLARAAEAAGARAAIALVAEGDPEAADGILTLVYEGPEELTAAALAKALGPRMLPRRMLWVVALPRLPSGKIDRAGVELLASLALGHP